MIASMVANVIPRVIESFICCAIAQVTIFCVPLDITPIASNNPTCLDEEVFGSCSRDTLSNVVTFFSQIDRIKQFFS